MYIFSWRAMFLKTCGLLTNPLLIFIPIFTSKTSCDFRDHEVTPDVII